MSSSVPSLPSLATSSLGPCCAPHQARSGVTPRRPSLPLCSPPPLHPSLPFPLAPPSQLCLCRGALEFLGACEGPGCSRGLCRCPHQHSLAPMPVRLCLSCLHPSLSPSVSVPLCLNCTCSQPCFLQERRPPRALPVLTHQRQTLSFLLACSSVGDLGPAIRGTHWDGATQGGGPCMCCLQVGVRPLRRAGGCHCLSGDRESPDGKGDTVTEGHFFIH